MVEKFNKKRNQIYLSVRYDKMEKQPHLQHSQQLWSGQQWLM